MTASVTTVQGYTVTENTGVPIRPESRNVPAFCQPPSVAAAFDAHVDVLCAYDEATVAAREAKGALTTAKATDIKSDAALLAAGKPPLKPEQRQAPKAEAALEEAERRRLVMTVAGISTFNALVAAVRDDRDAWLAAIDKAAAEATVAYDEALAALASAASRLAETAGARRWLGAALDNAKTNGDALPRMTSSSVVRVKLGKFDQDVEDLVAALRQLTAAEI